MNGHEVTARFKAEGGPKSRAVTGQALDLALTIAGSMPDCREKSCAVTHLEEAVMWALKGLGGK